MSIPPGKAGVVATLKLMRNLVRQYKKDLTIRNLALSIIRNLNQKAWKDEIKYIHAFVRDKIRYVRDIRGIETIYTPVQILNVKQGDCDDKSVLLATLLESINHPTRFIAVGFIPKNYSHVYVETKLGKKWIPLETTENVPMGWEPKKIVTKLVMNN